MLAPEGSFEEGSVEAGIKASVQDLADAVQSDGLTSEERESLVGELIERTLVDPALQRQLVECINGGSCVFEFQLEQGDGADANALIAQGKNRLILTAENARRALLTAILIGPVLLGEVTGAIDIEEARELLSERLDLVIATENTLDSIRDETIRNLSNTAFVLGLISQGGELVTSSQGEVVTRFDSNGIEVFPFRNPQTGDVIYLDPEVPVTYLNHILAATTLVHGGSVLSTGRNAVSRITSGSGGITNLELPSTTARTQNLRTNLQRDGFHFDAGEEAHHIVAKNDPRAAEARELLSEADVDINSPANGVPLPGTSTVSNPNNKAVHRGDLVHSQGYYDYVNSELRSVTVSQRPQVIRRIASELEQGQINW